MTVREVPPPAPRTLAPSHRRNGNGSTQVRFYLPALTLDEAESRAKALGLSFNAYVRSLVEADLQAAS